MNVALFVPDEGCPHRCSFCNQKTISGKTKRLTTDDVISACETALENPERCKNGQIAFFGGSFTAIERSYMISLLEPAWQYVERKCFCGIRISTRPDCIDGEILQILKKYGVNSIELGCQSMDDEVLRLNERGHTSGDCEKAARLIKAQGFELGVQMMTGLYGDTNEKCLETARRLIALKPDTVRIYPTIVLENTALASLYKSGKYKAQTLEEAVWICSKLLYMFHESSIPVIRLGLHSGGNVEEGYVAGAFHPAFRELCEGKIYFDKTLRELEQENAKGKKTTVFVGEKYVSQFVGQKRCNIEKLLEKGYDIKIKTDSQLSKYEIRVVYTR